MKKNDKPNFKNLAKTLKTPFPSLKCLICTQIAQLHLLETPQMQNVFAKKKGKKGKDYKVYQSSPPPLNKIFIIRIKR